MLCCYVRCLSSYVDVSLCDCLSRLNISLNNVYVERLRLPVTPPFSGEEECVCNVYSQVEACVFSYLAASMAMPLQIANLQQLLKLLSEAPITTIGDQEWWSFKLTDLAVRDNLLHPTYINNQQYWAAVQVKGMVINGQPICLSDELDAHISLGTWVPHHNLGPAPWLRALERARKLLARKTEIELLVRFNVECCRNTLLLFSLEVHSKGGVALQALQQTLDACGMACLKKRGMSPPGLVFHLSVYDCSR